MTIHMIDEVLTNLTTEAMYLYLYTRRLQRCVPSEESYFEGDNVKLLLFLNIFFLKNQSHYLIYRPCIC